MSTLWWLTSEVMLRIGSSVPLQVFVWGTSDECTWVHPGRWEGRMLSESLLLISSDCWSLCDDYPPPWGEGEEGGWVNRRKLSLMSWALPFSPHPSLPLRSQGWSGGPGRGSTAHLFFCPPTSCNQCISALLHWWGGHGCSPTGTVDIVCFSPPLRMFSLRCLIFMLRYLRLLFSLCEI